MTKGYLRELRGSGEHQQHLHSGPIKFLQVKLKDGVMIRQPGVTCDLGNIEAETHLGTFKAKTHLGNIKAKTHLGFAMFGYSVFLFNDLVSANTIIEVCCAGPKVSKKD